MTKSSRPSPSDQTAKANSKRESKKDTKSSEKSNKQSSHAAHISAAAYIMTWANTALGHYTAKLTEFYLDPLNEHCFKKKKSANKSGEDQQKVEQNELRDKLNKALSKLRDWEAEEETDERAKDSLVTMAELALVYRLRTLAEMMKDMHKIGDRIVKDINKFDDKLSSQKVGLLQSTKHIFEFVSAIAEVFKLKPLDRGQCKKEYAHHFRVTEKDEKGWRETDAPYTIDAANPASYVAAMESKTNYLRSIVHYTAFSQLGLVQSLYTAVKVTSIDVKMSECKSLMDRLPPAFLAVESSKLSKFNTELLSKPPKGRSNDYLPFLEVNKKTTTLSLDASPQKSSRKATRFRNPLSSPRSDNSKSQSRSRSSKRK